jgi:hypothetical protein
VQFHQFNRVLVLEPCKLVESLIPAIFLHRLSHIVALPLIDLLLYVMSDKLVQIKPSEVHFVEELRKSERGAIFRVVVRGRHCVMKVVNDLYPHSALHGSL